MTQTINKIDENTIEVIESETVTVEEKKTIYKKYELERNKAELQTQIDNELARMKELDNLLKEF